jgi:hemoglobin
MPDARSFAEVRKELSLYDKLGGVFNIASMVNRFSNELLNNPVVGRESKNPQLREWHAKAVERLPGLKFMRTLWICDATGGPFKFEATRPGGTELGLEEAHRALKITPVEFDEVASVLAKTLDYFKVPKDVKDQVLEAFAAHKDEVTAGHTPVDKGYLDGIDSLDDPELEAYIDELEGKGYVVIRNADGSISVLKGKAAKGKDK